MFKILGILACVWLAFNGGPFMARLLGSYPGTGNFAAWVVAIVCTILILRSK